MARLAMLALAFCAAFLLAASPAYAELTLGTLALPDACDFAVSGEEGACSFDEEHGVLVIAGDVTVSMKDGVSQTGQSIIVSESAKLTLDGINIVAARGPAILIESPAEAELILADGSVNTVQGVEGVNIDAAPGSFAGIEVEFEFEEGENPSNRMASLTISGNGTLNATGGPNAAGIGGSNSAGGSKGKGLYGNITIESGTVNATAPGGGAGIGSSNNPAGGTSSGSYKQTGNNVWGVVTINGGTVDAKSTGSGAGIGGGNHVDSGKIVINGGTVTADGAAGIGCGIGSSKNGSTDKGPGYYFADVEINGGTITATSNDIGAAIGGGMYCDALVKITGGENDATGGSRQGNSHHGGAGIGGGYLGHADVQISGGTISARGGDGAAGIGSGGSPNANSDRGSGGRVGQTTVEYTKIEISDGDIKAYGGAKGGAGIGLGTGGDKAAIAISGGTVYADGARSSEADMRGGAGIGSGFQGTGAGDAKYFVDADVDVSITGGDVIAIGGWGAAGIGSGADNKMANTIEVDASNASIQAYSDGTKFAIDTRILNDDGTTTSRTDGRTVGGDILQGTFVHAGEIGDYDQNPEGLPTILVTNDATGSQRNLTLMPEGYRSFAADVDEPGIFTVYTDADSIGHGEGRYFSCCTKDVWSEESVGDNLVQYTVETGKLSDNYYLFPVKTIVAEKRVLVDEAVDEADRPDVLNRIDGAFRFALARKGAEGSEPVEGKDGKPWIESIDVVDGVAQSKAYFVNIQDATYDVWEVDDQGNRMNEGMVFGSVTLKRIATAHGDDSSNNASISDEVWSDTVTVSNTFEPTPVEVVLRAEKTLDGEKPGQKVFEFSLKGVSDNAADVNLKAENDADGSVAFEALKFQKAGTYEYELAEVAGDDANVNYDSRICRVVVAVSADADGVLSASVEYDGSDAVPVFANATVPDDAPDPVEPTDPDDPGSGDPDKPTPKPTPTSKSAAKATRTASASAGKIPAAGDDLRMLIAVAVIVAAVAVVLGVVAGMRRRRQIRAEASAVEDADVFETAGVAEAVDTAEAEPAGPRHAR